MKSCFIVLFILSAVYFSPALPCAMHNIQSVSKPISQTFPRYFPTPLKQKSSYQHGSKSEQVPRYPQFLWKLLFTDEAMFTRDGIFNFHNVHIWAHANPRTIREARHQTTFSINVWAGIVGDRLTGPVRLPERLTGPTYRKVLERLTRDILPDVLDDVPFTLRVGMWFMHDGVPPHFSRIARQYLDDHFPGKWIGSNGPVAWPPRSPDLGGHIKNEVYSTPVTNVDELWERIVAAFDAIRNRPGQLERVRNP
jgi:hypothetical protein